MQRFLGAIGGGWADIADWEPDGTDYWYPWDPYIQKFSVGINYQYRLRCTLPSGEIYYSNAVGFSLVSTACECADLLNGVQGMSVEVDYSIQDYTSVAPPWPPDFTYGTEIDYTYGMNCQAGPNAPVRLYESTFGPPGSEITEYVDVYVFYQGVVGGELIAQVTAHYSGGFTQGASGRRDLADLQKGWRCYSGCYGFDEQNFPRDLYFCRDLRYYFNPNPEQYCAEGTIFKVKDIRIVTA